MMEAIKSFLKKGQLTIEINSKSPEKVLNKIWLEEIKVQNVIKKDIVTMYMEINFDDYKKIKKIVNKFNGKIKVVGKSGFMFWLYKIKRKFSLVFGFVVFAIVLFILSRYIWGIEIDTNRYVSPFEIRKVLTSIGIKPGISKGKVDIREIEKKIENLSSEIMWVRVRIEGSTLKVLIEEKTNPPLFEEKGAEGGIVAKMDGEIKQIYVNKGTANVKMGSFVKKGELLISPQQGNKEEFIEQVKAEGTVIAKTFYEKNVELKTSGEEEIVTGNKKSDIYISIFGKKIYLKKTIKNFNDYDKIEEKNSFIGKDIYIEKINKPIEKNKDDIIKEALDNMYKSQLSKLDKKAKIIEVIPREEDLGNGIVNLKVVYVVEQEIGESVSTN